MGFFQDTSDAEISSDNGAHQTMWYAPVESVVGFAVLGCG